MNTFEKVLRFITEKVAYGGMVAILVCVGLVVSNIVKRSLGFGLVTGTPELVELIAALILSLGIGYLTFVKGHVAVGILVDRFAPRKQAVFEVVTYAISLAVTIFLTWAMFKFGLYNQRAGWVTGVLNIPLYLFICVVAGSLALTCVVLIKDLAKAVVTIVKAGEGGHGR